VARVWRTSAASLRPCRTLKAQIQMKPIGATANTTKMPI
jgi:hypothetical protein